MKTGLADATRRAAPGPCNWPMPADGAAGQARGRAGAAGARARLRRAAAAGRALDTGEDAFAHADGRGRDPAGDRRGAIDARAAYLVYAGDFLQKPEEVVAKAFGESYAGLVAHTRRLVQIQRAAREANVGCRPVAPSRPSACARCCSLAFSRDLRVVLLRLASRLQTLRWYAASKRVPAALAEESMQVFAPLANRLGIWQIKWEIEDLSFRFLEPAPYRQVARPAGRAARRARAGASRRAALELGELRARAGLKAEVQGRPKHLYSIWKKMRGKGLDFARVFDIRAMRDRRRRAGLLRGAGARARALGRCRASSTTTSRGPSRTATSRCTPW